jgi:hypothetical protein
MKARLEGAFGVGPHQLILNQIVNALFWPVLGLKSSFSGAKIMS